MLRRQQLAAVIRRIPKIMQIPYHLYRFIQPKYSVGVVGVVLNKNAEILLVEHVFHPIKPWGLPGGWIGFNEDPSQAVIREFSEELDLIIDIERLLLMRRTQFNHLDIAYLCQTKGEIGNISYELLGYDWFKRENLPRLHKFHDEAIKAAFEHWVQE